MNRQWLKITSCFVCMFSNITSVAQATNTRVDLKFLKKENIKRMKTEPYVGIRPNDLKF